MFARFVGILLMGMTVSHAAHAGTFGTVEIAPVEEALTFARNKAGTRLLLVSFYEEKQVTGIDLTLAFGASDPVALYNAKGYDAIAAVVDDFLGRWLADPVLAPFFEHLDGDGKAHVRQMVVDQLCAATGGPCLYLGLDMATAHEDLAIAAGDWNVAMQHLLATLDKFGVPARERRELDDILRSVRADVVRGNGTP